MDILHETKNLVLVEIKNKLEIHWVTITHDVLVGEPKDKESGIKFMERAERYPQNLKRFLNC